VSVGPKLPNDLLPLWNLASSACIGFAKAASPASPAFVLVKNPVPPCPTAASKWSGTILVPFAAWEEIYLS